jgi:type IV pilus assembly protein PilB
LPIETKKRLGEILVSAGLLTTEQLQKALILQKSTGKKLGEVLVENNFVSEDDLIEVLEFQLGIPHVKLDRYPIDPEAVGLISETIAKRHVVIPIKVEGERIVVAMSDPLNVFAIDDINIYTGKEVQPVLAKSEEIRRNIDRYYSKQEAMKAAEDFMKEVGITEKLEKAKELAQSGSDDVNSAPMIKLVNSIFEQAINSRASDIHIEAFENEVKVRFRVDGILNEVMTVERKLMPAIVARIKVISNMDIAEKRVPQDGRTSYYYFNKEYEMRVSTLPTVYGEKIVIRIQDKSNFLKDKTSLGFSDYDMHKFDSIISAPHGIILVSGPTGSGKSTTLYTILKELNTGKTNIITVEDPVESRMHGVNQVEVNPKAGLTFATALRSILRQDPDIIMIGEIRDAETAEIAVRSAITGHLVLSTIHTNDAASSVTRLADMGIEHYLLSTSLVGVIAQRLVRRICPHCKEEYVPDFEEVQMLGLPMDRQYKFHRGKGCVYCSNKGYLGRTGIYEILVLNRELKNMIAKRVSSDELKDAAIKNGMKTLAKSCIEKILLGETTVEEYLRVTYTME